MKKKAAVSFPMVIIVSLIIIAIIIVLAYYFLYQGSSEISKAFTDVEQSFRKWICSLFGGLGGIMCG